MNDCIPVDQLGTLEQLSENDPRRRHAASCPRCSSLLFAYEAFVQATPREGADPAAADAQLDRFIATHVVQDQPERISGTPRRDRGRWFNFAFTKLVVASAAVVVMAVILVRWQPWESKPIVYRGEQKLQFSGLIATRSNDGTVELGWAAVAHADAYRVTILGADLSEITRLDPTPGLSTRLGATTNATYWQVTALEEGAEILTSDPQRLP